MVAVLVEALHGLQPADLHGTLGGEGVQRPLSRDEPGGRGPAEVQPVRSAGVLGEVDRAGGRVDRRRLVGVPAQELQREGRSAEVRGLARGVHLEDVAVVLGEGPSGPGLGLLTGEPGAPGRDSSGAVVPRAGDRRVLLDHGVVGIEHDRRGATDAAGVVDETVDVWHRVLVRAGELVVRHDHRAAARAGEAPHGVRVSRVDEAARPGDTRSTDHLVAEALREGEQRTCGREGAVARTGAGGRRGRAQKGVEASGSGQREAEGRGRAADEGPPGQGVGHGCSWRKGSWCHRSFRAEALPAGGCESNSA